MSYEEDAAPLRIPPETLRLFDRLQARAQRAVLLSLPSGEPRHYLYDLLPTYPLRTGKGLRPVLCMAACEAYGGTYDDALPFAAAVELLHNAFLVHDDIQDGSIRRRGRPALHVEHGVPLALNAGDALAALATAKLVRAARTLPPPVAVSVLDGWERMNRETIEGQALDLGWQRDGVLDLDEEAYLAMCGKKTAWYTGVQPLAMGAAIGSGNPSRAAGAFRFGWLLGLLFQLANDLDGVRGSDGAEDIVEGKRTLLVIHLLATLDPPGRAEAARILNLPRGGRSAAEVAWVVDRMEETGTIDHAREGVLALAVAARVEAEAAFGSLPASPGRDLLLSTTDVVLVGNGLGPRH